jgi:hypothetical protein
MNPIQLLSDFLYFYLQTLSKTVSKKIYIIACQNMISMKSPNEKERAAANSSEAKPSYQFMDRNANICTEATNYLDSASTDFQDALCQLYIQWNNNFTPEKPSKRLQSVAWWN